MATPDELLAIVRRGYEAGWNRGDMGILDHLLAADFRAYDPTVPGGVVTRAAVRDFLQQIASPFPTSVGRCPTTSRRETRARCGGE